MASGNNEQPIIIKKIYKVHGAHHGGAWKVAFADFMTAMMAFFLVMWLVGQSPEVRNAVAGHFRDPGKHLSQGKAGILKGSSSAIKSNQPDRLSLSIPSKESSGPTKQEIEKLKLTAKNIIKELEQKREFQRLKKNIKMQLTSEGLRIILNESENSPAFFEPGSAKLLQKSAIILIIIARQLGELTNHLVIEGHTNRRPTGNKIYTNWELSADRANSARQLMEVSGLFKGQVREIRGYAGKFPMIENDPGDPRNRRVSLIVLYKARERAFDQLQVGADLMAEI